MSYRSGNVSTFAVAAFVFVVFVYVSLAMLFKLNIFMSKQGCFKFQFLLSDLCWHHFHHQQKVSQQFLILDFCATTDNVPQKLSAFSFFNAYPEVKMSSGFLQHPIETFSRLFCKYCSAISYSFCFHIANYTAVIFTIQNRLNKFNNILRFLSQIKICLPFPTYYMEYLSYIIFLVFHANVVY